VMSLYSKPPDAIIVSKSSGITDLKGLAGKTVATAPFSSSNTLWPVLLAVNGVDASSIKLIKTEPATMAPMLAQGTVDAAIAWGSVSAGYERILKLAGKEAVVLPWSAFGLDGYGLSLMASDKSIKERPEMVRGVIRALRKGFAFALSNPDGAAADLKASVPEADVKDLAAEFRASIPYFQNEVSTANGFGAFEPKLLRNTWIWVAKSMKYPENKVDPEKLVDRSFLK
jgi:NitT/TauT family transport system substrate-binding protein